MKPKSKASKVGVTGPLAAYALGYGKELAAQGYVIAPVDMSGHDWIDVGTPERLAEAEKAV